MSGGSNHTDNQAERGGPDPQKRVAELEAEVAQLKQAKRAWVESEQRFREAFEKVQFAAVWSDRQGRITFCNDFLLRLTGWRREEIMGQGWFDLFSSDPSVRQTREKQFAQDATPTHFEGEIATRQGDRRTLAWNTTVLRDPEGAVIGAVSLGEDITERKRAEEALRESEGRFRAIFEQASVGVAQVASKTGRFLRVNQRYCDIVGYTNEEMAQGTFQEITHPDDLQADLEDVRRLLEGRIREYSKEKRYRRKDGSIVWVRLTVSPMWRVATEPSTHIAVVEDITERKRATEALRTSEAILNETGRIARIGGWEHDLITGKATWTKALYDIIEVESGAPPGPNEHLEYYPPRDRAILAAAYQRAVETGEPFDLELQCHTAKSRRFWARVIGQPVFREGQCVRVVGTFQDITERKRAEEALRESNETLRALIQSSPLATAALDPEGNVTLWNRAAEQMFGWCEHEVLGRRLPIVPEDKREEHRALRERALRGELLTDVEIRRRKKDGTPIDISVSAAPLHDARGQVSGVMTVTADITERKRVEEALKEREEKLTSIFRAAPVGIGMVISRVMQEVNDTMCQITGYSRQELLGQSARMVYPSDEEFEYVGREKYGQIADQGAGAVETRWKRKDGAIIHIVLSSTPLDTADLSKGVIFTALDITERKRAEEERLEMERRLQHTQKLESLGVLAGGIAHDFNNLLTAILGNLDVALLDLSVISPARPHIEEAMRACHRAADLTRQMLAYSGKGRFVVRSIDLSAVVKENVQIFGAAIARTATLNLHLARNLPPIQADPGQMQQVIMNLLTNASEALGENPGVITLATGLRACDEAYLDKSRVKEKPSPGEFIYVEVSDTGSGMDEETQQRLFDPFFTTKFMGRGLGMSAVLGIVRGHRGAILVDSEAGRGTTIRVLFPVSEKDRNAAAIADQAGDSRAATADRPSRSGTILVVDDEEMVRNPCQAMLEHLGFRVLAAADGQEALEVFRAHADEIVCVVLDLTMPRMDGVTAFRELRCLRPDVKVLLASGYNEQEATQRFVGQGLAGFIQKPYRLQDLEERIEWVLSRTG